jgi:hypothetical protein
MYIISSLDGWYMFIDSSKPNRKGQKARIQSVTNSKSSNSVHCLRFAYYMYGDNVGSLNIYLGTSSNRPSFPSYTLTGSKGNEWFRQRLTVTFNANVDFYVVFEGKVGDGLKGSIGLDDIQIEDGACSKSICDFEDENICNYTNDVQNTNFNWTRNSGPTDSLSTGPSIDHTTQTSSGHYMYIE